MDLLSSMKMTRVSTRNRSFEIYSRKSQRGKSTTNQMDGAENDDENDNNPQNAWRNDAEMMMNNSTTRDSFGLSSTFV
jgi:hypothetical protein